MRASKALENLWPCIFAHPHSCKLKTARAIKTFFTIIYIRDALTCKALPVTPIIFCLAISETSSTSSSNDCRNCQTSDASPAKPGGLPLTLVTPKYRETRPLPDTVPIALQIEKNKRGKWGRGIFCKSARTGGCRGLQRAAHSEKRRRTPVGAAFQGISVRKPASAGV